MRTPYSQTRNVEAIPLKPCAGYAISVGDRSVQVLTSCWASATKYTAALNQISTNTRF